MQKDLFPTFRAELRELGKYKNPLKIPITLEQFLCLSIIFGSIIYIEIYFAYFCLSS